MYSSMTLQSRTKIRFNYINIVILEFFFKNFLYTSIFSFFYTYKEFFITYVFTYFGSYNAFKFEP